MMLKKTIQMCAGGLVLVSMTGHAQVNWISSSSGDWAAGANWSSGAVPTSSDTVQHTTYGNTISVTTAATANQLYVSHADTAIVNIGAVGSLTVSGNSEIGNAGAAGAAGKLVVDGGSVSISGDIEFGKFGTRTGIGELNSGSMTVSGTTYLGGWNADATGILTINGGTYTAINNFFTVGRTGSGTLNMYGGTLQLQEDTGVVWDALRIGTSSGNGTVNLYGGEIRTGGIIMEKAAADAGMATINLSGGTLQVEQAAAAAIQLYDDAQMVFDTGVFKWKGNEVANFTTFVGGGFITWTNGMTNMLTESWDAAWTNGASVLYADYNDADAEYTTVWAYNTITNITPPPPPPPPLDGPTTNVFNNGSGDGLYTTSNNWDIGSVPTGEDLVLHTSIGGVCLIDSPVEAGDMEVSHVSTATVSVVTGGSLNVSNSVELAGNIGAVGSVGKLLVDGGSVSIGGDLTCGLFGARHGMGELNSGSLTVGGATYLGGWNADSQGTMTINDGTYTAPNGIFYVGRNSGAGTLNMNGGTLQLDTSGTVNSPLRVANGTGDGIINLNGGAISTSKILVDNTAGGAATVNLNAGLLQVEGGYTAAVDLRNAAQMVFDAGVLKWKSNRVVDIASLVDSGFISWDTVSTNMLTTAWDAAWTNGTTVLYADYNDAEAGYTTVWAASIAKPVTLRLIIFQ